MISPCAFDTSPSTPPPPPTYRSRATSSPLTSHRKSIFSSCPNNNRDYLPSPEPLGSSRVLTKSPKWWRSPQVPHSRQRRNSSSPNIILLKQPSPTTAATSINKYEVVVFSLCILAVFFTWTVLEFELSSSAASSHQLSVLTLLCGALSLALLALCINFIRAVSNERKTCSGLDAEQPPAPGGRLRASRSASFDPHL